MSSTSAPSPVVIVGAGPIGLAAAAHAHVRGLPAIVLEAGASVGAAVRAWGHVRLFSPWAELVDPAAADLLLADGWVRPEATDYPTGAEWAERYLEPLTRSLVATGAIEVRLGHRVTGVARRGRDRLVDSGRDEADFSVHVEGPDGPLVIEARAVIDASGTWGDPNPLGAEGLPALGELAHGDRITYGIPDLADPATRQRYAGRHVAVAGTGASAQNTLVGLADLARAEPGTRVTWLVRRGETATAFGGGDADQLEARGALGTRARRAVESGTVQTLTGFRTVGLEPDPGANGTLRLVALDGRHVDGIDEIVVVTGFRPDLTWLSEVRLDLDPVLSAPRQLAPLIDPNVHSCGTVYPHGAAELTQPESGLYLAGMKSYGRATSFLALTGFEQVRSIVAAIAGDHAAAARVELVLPETGVCGGSGLYDGLPADDAGGCCGPTPASPELITLGTRSAGGCG
ncbi:NAD(P)-binding domain-containing protein [Nocardioides caeni]|nr:NAD(P)-binding domain-containing protein [Nocardioides caeni]